MEAKRKAVSGILLIMLMIGTLSALPAEMSSSISVKAQSLEAKIIVDPDYSHPGEIVNIQGYNFAPVSGEKVSLELWDEDLVSKVVDIGEFETDLNGDFTGTFQIPAVIERIYTLKAVQANYNIEAYTDFYIIFIIVVLSTYEGPPDTEVTLKGMGFSYDEKWSATFGDIAIFENENVDLEGFIYGTFYVPNVDVGTYTITVMDIETEIEIIVEFNVIHVQMIWTVDDDLQDYPDADFTRIQDAVDAATAGDTIIVHPGTYIENVDIAKSLTINSESGAKVTIVEAAYFYDHVFEVRADYVNINGFTIRGALKEVSGAHGLDLNNANDCKILNNNVIDNHIGIWLYDSSNNTLTDNVVKSNKYTGIGFESSSNNILTNNALSDNYFEFGVFGREFFHFVHYIDTSNTLNEKPIQYLVGKKDLVIDSSWDVGYLGLVNCTNISVKDLTLTNNRQGILLAYSTHSRIEEVNILSNNIGISLYGSSYNILIKNNVNYNYAYGVWLRHSSNNIVTNNIVNSYFCRAGIGLENSFKNILTDNTVSRNYYGILLENNSPNNVLTNNTANLNRGYGIGLYSSSNNKIYLNNFIENNENVYSDSTNSWNSPETITYTYKGNSYTNYLGNYWSDYAGSDTDGDGIGDTPYSIDSDKDYYPLMESFENYRIGLVESPWPMFQYDPQHTGQSPYVGVQRAILRWTYPFGEGAYSQPVIDSNNVIYIRTAGGIVHAINPNGTPKWSVHVGGNGDSIYGSLAIGKDSTVYVGTETFGITYFRTLRAFNQNGVLKWQFSTSANIAPAIGPDTSVTLGPDGTAYFLGTKMNNDRLSNVLYSLSSEGSVKWELVLEGFAHSSPTIASDGSIYLASQKLWALDEDGVPKWSFGATSDSRYGQPIVGSDGTIYMTAIEPGTTPGGQNLVAVHPNGMLKWRVFVDTAGYSRPQPAMSEDNTIYLAGTVGIYIIAIDASTGSSKWSYQTNEWLWPTTPVIGSDGTIYIGSEFSKFSAINRDGTLKWEYIAEQDISVGPYYTPAAIGSDGTVYVATYSANGNHRLYAFGPGPTPENRPPTCSIKLQKDGIEISEIDVGAFFDIYVGDSTDDIGIKEVRFSSDDVQDGIPTGEWTGWYDWDIFSGDWDISSKIKRWAFATDGDKEVWAEVKDNIGQTDQCYAIIMVPALNQPPLASFTYSPENPKAGEWITFDASPSYDPEGEALLYAWGFSDGYSALGVKATHSFLNEGEYTVTLTVTDPMGSSATIIHLFYVRAQPIVHVEFPYDYPSHLFFLSQEVFKTPFKGRIAGVNYENGIHEYVPEDTVNVNVEIERIGGKVPYFVYMYILDPSGNIIYEDHLEEKIWMEYEGEKRAVQLSYNIPDIHPGKYHIVTKLVVNLGCLPGEFPYIHIEIPLDYRGLDSDTAPPEDYFIIKGDFEYSHSVYIQGEGFDKLKREVEDLQKTFFPVYYKMHSPAEEAGTKANFVFEIDPLREKPIHEDYKKVIVKPKMTSDAEIEKEKILNKYENAIIELKLIAAKPASLSGAKHTAAARYLSKWVFSFWKEGVKEAIIKIIEKTMDVNWLGNLLTLKDIIEPVKGYYGADLEKTSLTEEFPVYLPKDTTITLAYWGSISLPKGPLNIPLGYIRCEKSVYVSDQLNTIEIPITIEQSSYFDLLSTLDNQDFQNILHINKMSPGELRVYDSQGRITGLVNGEVKNEIPKSNYDLESESVTIFSSTDSYRYEVVSTDEGSYGLVVTCVEDGVATTFTATDIPIGANAIHQFNIDWGVLSIGEKGVTMQIDSNGDGSIEQTIYTDATLQPPVADAGGPYEGDEGSPISFDASGSHDPDGIITLYEWDFDGVYDTSSNLLTATFTWGDDYLSIVTLRVTDDDGLTSIYIAEVKVDNIAPIVEAGPDQTVECCVDTVSFSGSFTDAGWLDTHTIEWDFGDGSTAIGTLDPTHVFLAGGVYDVILKVMDDDGGVGKDTLTVTVISSFILKNDALSELQNIIGVYDKHIDHKINKAMEHIEKSLDSDLWIDDEHLDSKHGHKVFDEEKKAVKELKKLMDKEDIPQSVKDACQSVIDKLIEADDMLARTAYEGAQAYAGDKNVDKELEKCENEFEKAQRELDHTKKDGTPDPHYDKAIDNYKKAWEHAQKALKHAPIP